MRKKMLSVAFAIAASLGSYASPITVSQAAKIADRFVYGRSMMFANNSVRMSVETNEIKPFYVFNIGNDNGFVIVAGDDAVNPILGYSYEGHFDIDNMPDNVKSLMDSYDVVISDIQKMKLPAKAYVRTSSKERETISPLLKSKWNQDGPYNNLCPYLGGGTSMVGCVPLALSQLMNYYQWPAYEVPAIPAYTFTEIFPEEGQEPKEVSVDGLPAITFNWEGAALESIGNPEFDNAVAEICRYAGQACKAAYNALATGSNTYSMVGGMMDYLSYSSEIMVLDHNDFSDEEKWEDIIYNELQEKRPIIIGASPKTGYGHEFICDGYENSKYHINWGWGGAYDGFFELSNLNPEGTGIGGNEDSNYSYNYSIVIHATPDAETFQVYSEPLIVAPGTDQKAELKFNCDDNKYISVQFDMYLPKGVSLIENGDGTPKVALNTLSDHTVKCERLANNDYRFTIMSASNSALKMDGNSLMTLDIAVDADAKIDEKMNIITKNGIVSNTMFRSFDFNPYYIPLKEESDILLGDADDDDVVDEYDFDAMRKGIMKDRYNEISVEKSDINMDGSVDVADLMLLAGILQKSKGNDTYFEPTVQSGMVNVTGNIYEDSNNPKGKYIYPDLNNAPAAKAVQFDVKLPKGAYISYIWSVGSDRTCDGWYSWYQYIDDDTYRIMLYHPEGKNIKKHFDATVALYLEWEGELTTEFSNVVVATTDYKKVTDKSVEIPTGIDNADVRVNGSEDKVYTIEGIRLNNADNLPKGIYIINGKKTVIK